MSVANIPSSPGHLVLQSDLTRAARRQLALVDVRDAAGMWRLAATLGWFDIRLRYRGSMLGPFWLTLSTAVMVAALGVLYSELFKMELHDYLPFLALSLVLWGFVSTLIAEACTCFTQAEGMVRSMRMPFAVHAARVVVRNLLVLGHNVVVILAVYAWFDVWPGWAGLAALPALALWVLDGIAVCLLLGPIGARFRDIPPIVGSVTQIAFFVSPIIWKPELLQGNAARFLWANPFYTLLEIGRAPLLGTMPSHLVWASALAYSLVLWIAAWTVFARVRGRLAFWV
ncbi:MAG: ABC transporter permease [Acetobacteraceae bacterium]